MLYALLIYGNEAEADATPEGMRSMLDAYQGYEAWLEHRGIKRAAEALYPTDRATTMRVRDDEAMTTDGPFADTSGRLRQLVTRETTRAGARGHWRASIPRSGGPEGCRLDSSAQSKLYVPSQCHSPSGSVETSAWAWNPVNFPVPPENVATPFSAARSSTT